MKIDTCIENHNINNPYDHDDPEFIVGNFRSTWDEYKLLDSISQSGKFRQFAHLLYSHKQFETLLENLDLLYEASTSDKLQQKLYELRVYSKLSKYE